METLTKENFWNEMEQKYPKAMKHFQNWIDGYKRANYWSNLFNEGISWHWNGVGEQITEAPKYHELPIAMQFGIFAQYYSEFCLQQEWLYNQPGLYNLSRGVDEMMKQWIATAIEVTDGTLRRLEREDRL